MSYKWVPYFLALVVALGTVAFAYEKVTVTGTIYEYEADDDGNILSVYLDTEDETFFISNAGKGRELHKLVNKKVRLSGDLVTSTEEYPTITVTEYQVINE